MHKPLLPLLLHSFNECLIQALNLCILTLKALKCLEQSVGYSGLESLRNYIDIDRYIDIGACGQSLCDLDGKKVLSSAPITGHLLNSDIWRELKEPEGIICCVEANNRFEEALSLLGIVVLTKDG